MPLVTASEAGRAQVENLLHTRVTELYPFDGLSVTLPVVSPLKDGIREGENPVCPRVD